eukprot:CAMPEP_0115035910 /NCGR_PEP_ID=MMETSP0216-20121206/41777_1 /TAXON_ID=223996 /ORGANISM="Protocruzia adherens, Strain Boccale" /LENGTH=234 /DNA_ID=CAMNT_0002415575 /DNA_START=51 /DNA_END=755 /DNA_ORIENTATION=-
MGRRRRSENIPLCTDSFLVLPYNLKENRFDLDNYYAAYNASYTPYINPQAMTDITHNCNQCFEGYGEVASQKRLWRWKAAGLAMALMVVSILTYSLSHWYIGFIFNMGAVAALIGGNAYVSHLVRTAYQDSATKLLNYIDRQNQYSQANNCLWKVGRDRRWIDSLQLSFGKANQGLVVQGNLLAPHVNGAQIINVDQGTPLESGQVVNNVEYPKVDQGHPMNGNYPQTTKGCDV